MGLVHISSVRIGAEISLVVIQAEPRRCDHIDPFALRYHGVQGIVSRLPPDGMETQIYFAGQGQRRILRRHIVRHRDLRLRKLIAQALILHIADE